MTENKENSVDIKSLADGQEKNGYLYAIRLLSVTKRSERELRKRLKEKGYQDSAIEKVVHVLKEQKYLNDLSLAKQQVEYSIFGNPKGRKRIRFELKHKGLSDTVIENALDSYDSQKELELATELAARKFEQMNDPDVLKRKKRVFDFLSRRGFDYEICRSVTAKLNQQT